MPLPVADAWFKRESFADGVTLLSEPYVDPFVRCNVWHVRGRDRDLVVDTGLGVASLRQAAVDLFERPVTAVLTHSHFDHIVPEHFLTALPSNGFAPDDYAVTSAPLTGTVVDGDRVDLGDRAFEVLHLPGIPRAASRSGKPQPEPYFPAMPSTTGRSSSICPARASPTT